MLDGVDGQGVRDELNQGGPGEEWMGRGWAYGWVSGVSLTRPTSLAVCSPLLVLPVGGDQNVVVPHPERKAALHKHLLEGAH